MNKIALGTAQFGMDYGINNKRGMVGPDEVFRMLDEAAEAGIDTIDTAYSYGASEKVIGEFVKTGKRTLNVISKQPACPHLEVRKFFEGSLKRLGMSRLSGYLVHSFESYRKDEGLWTELEELKRDGVVDRIGFSLYLPSELEYILDKELAIDILQLPFSVFDQRFSQYLPEIKRRNIHIYARSIFLQGLVFKAPAEIDSYFRKMFGRIESLNHMAEQYGKSIASLCINFVMANQHIDKLVVGVDGMENLKDIISILRGDQLSKDGISKLSSLRIDDEDMLLPYRWKLSKEKS